MRCKFNSAVLVAAFWTDPLEGIPPPPCAFGFYPAGIFPGSGTRFKITRYEPKMAQNGCFLPTKCAHAQAKTSWKLLGITPIPPTLLGMHLCSSSFPGPCFPSRISQFRKLKTGASFKQLNSLSGYDLNIDRLWPKFHAVMPIINSVITGDTWQQQLRKIKETIQASRSRHHMNPNP